MDQSLIFAIRMLFFFPQDHSCLRMSLCTFESFDIFEAILYVPYIKIRVDFLRLSWLMTTIWDLI